MNRAPSEKFFEILGEIWRDISLIEFLMRVCIAQKEGDIQKFPLPPYIKGKECDDYPKAFSLNYFNDVAKKFNHLFPGIAIPQELIDLRNAMAHGLIAEINRDGVDRLIKFRKQKSTEKLRIEFSLTLEVERIETIRASLRTLRQSLALNAADK